MKCSVNGCPNVGGGFYPFSSFPRQRELQFEWLIRCGYPSSKTKTTNTRQLHVCSKHFQESDFTAEFIAGVSKPRKRILRPDAVPSLFLSPESGEAQKLGNKKYISQKKQILLLRDKIKKLESEVAEAETEFNTWKNACSSDRVDLVDLDKPESHSSYSSSSDDREYKKQRAKRKSKLKKLRAKKRKPVGRKSKKK